MLSCTELGQVDVICGEPLPSCGFLDIVVNRLELLVHARRTTNVIESLHSQSYVTIQREVDDCNKVHRSFATLQLLSLLRA